MDPLSIGTASATLISLCAKLTGQIYIFVSKARLVDDAIRTLRIEIESLSEALVFSKQCFDDPLLTATVLNARTRHEGRHWLNVHRVLDDCGGTLKRLNDILQSVDQCEGQFLIHARKQIKLDVKSGEIAILKEQITSCRRALQLSLHLISVSSLLSNEAFNETLSSRLEELMDQMQQLRKDFRDQIQTQIVERGLERNTFQMMNNLDDCIRSAEVIASVASTIVHSRSTTASLHRENTQSLDWHERARSWLENGRFIVSGASNDEIPESSSPTSMARRPSDPNINTTITIEASTASPTNPFRRTSLVPPTPEPSISTSTFWPPTPARTDYGRVSHIHRNESTVTFPNRLCRVTEGFHANKFFTLQSIQYRQIETTLPRIADVVVSPTCRTLAIYYHSAEYELEVEIFGISESSAFTLLCNRGNICITPGSKVVLADKYMAIQGRQDDTSPTSPSNPRVKIYDNIYGNLLESLEIAWKIGPIAINSSGSMMAVNIFSTGGGNVDKPCGLYLYLYKMSVAGSYRKTTCFISILLKRPDFQTIESWNQVVLPTSCHFSPNERYVSISYPESIATYDVTRQGQLVSEITLAEQNDLYGLYLRLT